MKHPEAGSMQPGSDARTIEESSARFPELPEHAIREIHFRWKRIMAEISFPKKP
jgi:hypothetical protein